MPLQSLSLESQACRASRREPIQYQMAVPTQDNFRQPGNAELIVLSGLTHNGTSSLQRAKRRRRSRLKHSTSSTDAQMPSATQTASTAQTSLVLSSSCSFVLPQRLKAFLALEHSLQFFFSRIPSPGTSWSILSRFIPPALCHIEKRLKFLTQDVFIRLEDKHAKSTFLSQRTCVERYRRLSRLIFLHIIEFASSFISSETSMHGSASDTLFKLQRLFTDWPTLGSSVSDGGLLAIRNVLFWFWLQHIHETQRVEETGLQGKKDALSGTISRHLVTPLKRKKHETTVPIPLGLVAGPEFRYGKRIFTHGNYSMYYSIRQQNEPQAGTNGTVNCGTCGTQVHDLQDLRLRRLVDARYAARLFEGKSVLDIGCNTGLVSFTVAGRLKAKSVVAVDIDTELIARCLESLRTVKYHYQFKFMSVCNTEAPRTTHTAASSIASPTCHNASPGLPTGTTSSDASVAAQQSSPEVLSSSTTANSPFFAQWAECLPPLPDSPVMPTELTSPQVSCFPFNLTFVAEDFTRLQSEGRESQFDTILCLSVTKWIHLNSGDTGIKRAFHTMERVLRPGGYIILEPQSWESYRKKRRLKDDFKATLGRINFKPHHFDNFLQEELHLHCVEVLQSNGSSGEFGSRPLFIYQKPESLVHI